MDILVSTATVLLFGGMLPPLLVLGPFSVSSPTTQSHAVTQHWGIQVYMQLGALQWLRLKEWGAYELHDSMSIGRQLALKVEFPTRV